MERKALLAIAASALLFLGAAAASAADAGKVKSLSDLDSGAGDYHFIYPHTGTAAQPRDAYTTVAPVHAAPQATPQPQRVDVPVDPPNSKPAAGDEPGRR